jgi:hypothetical protein
MSTKTKIFDVVFFQKNYEFLKLRMTEFEDTVDKFIFIPISDSKKKEIELNLSKFPLNKIIVGEVFQDYDSLQKEIQSYIEKEYSSFDDWIFLSLENELPDFKNLSTILESIKFNYVILEHLTFCWNIDYLEKIKYYGSSVFTFSHILIRNNLFSNIEYNKKNISEKIKNGWFFKNFHFPLEEELKIRENLLPTNNYSPATTYKLIERNFEIPNNFHILEYYKIGRNYMKKHLFFVDSEKKVNLIDIKKLYDTISIITFSENLDEIVAENIGDEVYKSVLYLPPTILYGNSALNEFQEKYKKNEIKRIIETIFPQDQDTIRIVYKDFNDIEKTWEELKNETLSEIINPS